MKQEAGNSCGAALGIVSMLPWQPALPLFSQ